MEISDKKEEEQKEEKKKKSAALLASPGPLPTAHFCLPFSLQDPPSLAGEACLSGLDTKGSAPAWSPGTQVRTQV